MATKILWRTLELEPLMDLFHVWFKRKTLPSDNKNIDFLSFGILADISVLFILTIIKIW